jgi:hypothetical protein
VPVLAMLTIYRHAVFHKHISVSFVSDHNQTESLRKLSQGSYFLILWFVKKENFFLKALQSRCVGVLNKVTIISPPLAFLESMLLTPSM